MTHLEYNGFKPLKENLNLLTNTSILFDTVKDNTFYVENLSKGNYGNVFVNGIWEDELSMSTIHTCGYLENLYIKTNN